MTHSASFYFRFWFCETFLMATIAPARVKREFKEVTQPTDEKDVSLFTRSYESVSNILIKN